MQARKKWIVLPAILLIVVVLAYFFKWEKAAHDKNVLHVSGNIEVTDAEVSFKIPGRVEKRLVSEGEIIRAGQPVAILDSTDLVREVALRKAEVEAAKAALAELEAGSRPQEIAQAEAAAHKAEEKLKEMLAGSRPQEIRAAEASVSQARADVERLKSDYERQVQLYKREVISAREFEVTQGAYKAASARLAEASEHLKLVREGPRKEEIEQARAALREARERFDLVKAGPRQETIDQSRARLKQAREALALAEIRLGYARIVSPLSGVVLSENIESGEYVSAGTPIVTVGDLVNVWLRAFINETDLGRVKVGQPVRVTTDTYPGKAYEGYVSFISSQAEFTPKNVQTEKERVKLVYRIKVDIQNPDMELKPGMPADADISLDREVR
ncbi:MAG: HlyD family efflux transporter periplasmic adaptor subunit [Deltaproteobacteria bacterium]|uniref:Hemolysin secretion protein D n=2 Tax=Desulforhabdus amnigena TaxID=40218 RepID=A0A9W6D1A7_9BACT|nr:HlyD family efflux transporter periplasmic adaptor subunit [Deltaproteobacteria bacterium]GLI34035.1 hemolysin secretion protein D [Desulforhabdus amnigena]